MVNLPNCPKCGNEYTYEDGHMFICPMCGAGVLKQGTRVKNIRLITDASDGHDIDCKIDGFGAMALKSEMVKKI